MIQRACQKNKNRLLALLLIAFFAVPLSAENRPALVIIIDDLGNNLETGKQVVALPGKLNLGVLPHTPGANELARLGSASGKEVLLHAPMSNLRHKPLGPGALTADMSELAFRARLADILDNTPHVRGLSNHMGSDLTTRREPMEWVMQELSARGLYFVDSRTTVHTLAARVADEYQVPHLSRQVFLDTVIEEDSIRRSFEQLLRRADREGLGVAIGHPYPETLKYLGEVLPELEQRGYRLVWISEVLAGRTSLARSAAP